MTKHDVMVPKALMKKAEKYDRELRATAVEYVKAEKTKNLIGIRLGRLWTVIETEGLHKYVRKAGSNRGYASLEEYAKSVKGVGHSTFFNQKKQGELADGGIPEETVAEIGTRKALILARVPAERRTPELVQKATEQSEKEFTRTAQAAVNDGQPANKMVTMRVEFFRRLHPSVSDKLENTIELYTQLKAVRQVDPEGNTGLTLQEKAIVTICSIAEGWAQGEECTAKEKAIDLGPEKQATEEDGAEEESDVEEADPFTSEEALAHEEELERAEAEANERSIHVMPAFGA